jgi:hypothetical protein
MDGAREPTVRNFIATGVTALALGAAGGALFLGGGGDGARADAAPASSGGEERTVRIPAARLAHGVDDMRVLVDPGFPDRPRSRRGDFAPLCVPSGAEGQGLAECVVHVDGEAGAITATGPVRADEPAAILAVTGGTGRYAGSSGRLRLTPLGDGTMQAAFELRLAGDDDAR